MKAQPIFFYDTFLSHRRGDAAAELRIASSAFECSVWFDENKPLSDRRLARVLAMAFGRARTILGYLSRDIASSPWPLLELRCGLGTGTPDCERVLFFVPNGVEIDRLGLPEDIMKVIRSHPHYGPETVRELAEVLTERNRVPNQRFCRFQDGRQPLPLTQTDRNVIRVRIALDCYRQSVVGDTHADRRGPIHRPEKESDQSLDDPKLLMVCAEIISEKLLAFALGEFDQTLYALRNIIPHKSQSEFAPELVRLILAIAAIWASSDHEDNRANALMLLKCITSADVSGISQRFLRMRLTSEPTWEVARLCLGPKNVPDSAWPRRLFGVERQALKDKESGVGSTSEAAGWLPP
jgi:hypothetical protein